MSTITEPTITPEVVSDDTPTGAIVKIVKEAKLEDTSTQLVLGAFKPFAIQVQDWKAKVDALVKEGVEPTKEECKIIHDSRMVLVKVRTGAEKRKKDLKADALAYSRALDAASNYIADQVKPLEEKLENAEKFAERREAARKAALKESREKAVAPYEVDTTFYRFDEMSEEAFQQVLNMARTAFEAKQVAAQKAEEDRLAKEKADAEERARIQAENARLKKEAEEREKALVAERAQRESEEKARKQKEEQDRKDREEKERVELARRTKVHASRLQQLVPYLSDTQKKSTPTLIYADISDAEFTIVLKDRKDEYEKMVRLAEERRKADEEAQRQAQIAFEKVRAEKELREQAETEAKRLKEAAEAAERKKREEEERQKKEAQLAAKRAAQAPDKEKLTGFAAKVRALELPVFKTDDGKTIGKVLAEQVEKFANWIDKQAGTL